MSDPPNGVQHLTTGSIAGTHDTIDIDDILVAPTTEGEKNTLRAAILPVACFSIQDIRFAFDSSFVLDTIAPEIPHLFALRTQHKDKDTGLLPPLSIFGHADPTGSDDYNKALSGRRAIAIYALLTRHVDLWNDLYEHPLGRDDWKKTAIAAMLDKVSPPSSDEDVQRIHKDKTQRLVLFRVYMDALCGDLQVLPTDFLAQGADGKKGKGDFQGCSDFNPLLIFSKEDERRFEQDKDKTDRDNANALNRRVMIFLFRPGAKVDPQHWPCPRATEGATGCHKRFWSDGDKRRHTRLPDEPRRYEDTQDTFACRFYDRMATDSPCERIILVNMLTLRVLDGDDKPFKNGRYRLEIFTEAPQKDAAKDEPKVAGKENSNSKTNSSENDSGKEAPLEATESTTNENGILQQLVPADAKFARLTLFPPASTSPANSSAAGSAPPGGVNSPAAAANKTNTDAGTDAKAGANGKSDPGQPAPPLWILDLNLRPPVDPETIAGAQARLNNLNLHASEKVDEEQSGKVLDPKTIPIQPDESLSADLSRSARLRRAIQRFQRLYKPHGDKEEATGELDDATKQKLVEKHGN